MAASRGKHAVSNPHGKRAPTGQKILQCLGISHGSFSVLLPFQHVNPPHVGRMQSHGMPLPTPTVRHCLTMRRVHS